MSSHPQFSSHSLPQSSRSSLKFSPLFVAQTTCLKVQLLTLLIKVSERKATTLDAGHICCSMAYYENHVESWVAVINNICCYCGLFIWLSLSVVVQRSDPVIVTPLKQHVINLACLDFCGKKIDEYCFCLPCYRLIKQKKVPRFPFLNKVNIVMYQDYPPILETLTLVEEMLIARCHPAMKILKLRPNKALSLVAYQRIRGHAVVSPQSSGPLSTIFPSPVVKLHEHI